MSGTSSSPTVPPYLLPDFDPSKAKVADLRGILLQHNIPYNSNAKKSELVNLFRTRILPLVPQLLAQLAAVRASDDGVLDGDSLDGSLKELDTDPEEFAQSEESTKKDGKQKKKSKRKSMVGRAQEAAAAAEQEEEEQEERASPRKKSGKSKRAEAATVHEEYPAEYDEVVPLAGEPSSSLSSPKKRKAAGDEGTPRSSSILKARRRTIQSEGEAGFSDYNPFQSGGEETPGRDLKRRKSSLGPERLKEAKSTRFEDDLTPSSPDPIALAAFPVPSTSTATPSSAVRKSSPIKPPTTTTNSVRPDLTSSNSWSSSTPEEARQRLLNPDGARKSSSSAAAAAGGGGGGGANASSSANRRVTMGPSTSIPPSSTSSSPIDPTKGKGKARFSTGGAGLGGTPIGVKYMVPVEKVKTTPPEAQKLMKEYEEHSRQEKLRRKREEEEKLKLDRELAKAEAEVRRLEEEQARERELQRQEDEAQAAMQVDEEEGQYELEDDPIEDIPLEEEAENDEFMEDRDPFEPGQGEEVDELEEELFGESAPAPPPVVAALRQDRVSTPRRSDPLPYYSPRQAHLAAQQQAAASTPRRSFPLPTPPTSNSRRQLVPANRPSKPLVKDQQAISLRTTPPSSLATAETVQTIKRVSGWTVLLLTIIYSLWWREEKLAVGFCDTNSSSNQLVFDRSTSLALPSLPSSLCTTLDALHLRPTCTPCPTHGFCEGGSFVGCSIDYVPRASALRLGGLVPIAPKCVPDTEKLMVVALQASKASKLLRRRRGEVVCGGLERLRKKQIASTGAGGTGDKEAFVYGLQADHVLSALLRENEASKSPFSEEVLEELNRLALNDLVNHGEVLTWQDGDDYWYASQTAEMPLSCQARLAAIRSAKKHKTGLAGLLSAVLSMFWLRYKLQARVQEKQRVAELVQTALVQLQRQERSHHADPVLVPFPHIAPSHLRDLVLQHVHSPTRRAQLWNKVEKVVEGNSNVRVMEVEQNGEELRGWQWVGATGAREIEAGGSSSSAASSPEKKDRPEMLQSGRNVLKR